jgi:hypothetical protein
VDEKKVMHLFSEMTSKTCNVELLCKKVMKQELGGFVFLKVEFDLGIDHCITFEIIISLTKVKNNDTNKINNKTLDTIM